MCGSWRRGVIAAVGERACTNREVRCIQFSIVARTCGTFFLEPPTGKEIQNADEGGCGRAPHLDKHERVKEYEPFV